MATKKQKRAAALAKREEFMAKVIEEGLKAQAWDRAQREIDAMRVREWAESYSAHVADILARHGITESE